MLAPVAAPVQGESGGVSHHQSQDRLHIRRAMHLARVGGDRRAAVPAGGEAGDFILADADLGQGRRQAEAA